MFFIGWQCFQKDSNLHKHHHENLNCMCTVGGCTLVFMPNSGDQRNFLTNTGFPSIWVLYQTGCTVYEKSPILFVPFLTFNTRHVQLNLNLTFTILKCLGILLIYFKNFIKYCCDPFLYFYVQLKFI